MPSIIATSSSGVTTTAVVSVDLVLHPPSRAVAHGSPFRTRYTPKTTSMTMPNDVGAGDGSVHPVEQRLGVLRDQHGEQVDDRTGSRVMSRATATATTLSGSATRAALMRPHRRQVEQDRGEVGGHDRHAEQEGGEQGRVWVGLRRARPRYAGSLSRPRSSVPTASRRSRTPAIRSMARVTSLRLGEAWRAVGDQQADGGQAGEARAAPTRNDVPGRRSLARTAPRAGGRAWSG